MMKRRRTHRRWSVGADVASATEHRSDNYVIILGATFIVASSWKSNLHAYGI